MGIINSMGASKGKRMAMWGAVVGLIVTTVVGLAWPDLFILLFPFLTIWGIGILVFAGISEWCGCATSWLPSQRTRDSRWTQLLRLCLALVTIALGMVVIVLGTFGRGALPPGSALYFFCVFMFLADLNLTLGLVLARRPSASPSSSHPIPRGPGSA